MVCFTLSEARAIDDSLWNRLDLRTRREVARRMILNRDESLRSCETDLATCRDGYLAKIRSEATQRQNAEDATADALMWQLKARGRGGRGMLIGIPLGGLATYGGLRLFRLVR